MKQVKLLAPMLAIAVVAFLAAPAQARKLHRANRASMDDTFATEAAQGGVAEVQMAQLALNKTSNQSVKDLANKLLTDHQQANSNLKSIATKDNISLPASMDAKAQTEYNKLQALSGANFDREYVNYQIQDHKKDISLFQRESEHGMNPDVKAFASQTLPTLQTHLSMAENAKTAVK